MIIYIITNKINGKQYIGQTIKTVKQRYAQHIRDAARGMDYPLYRAMKKYGIENFIVEEMAQADNINQLNDMEIWTIKNFWTLAPNGYNLEGGGKNNIVHLETRKKISLANTGRKQSDEEKKKKSDANKGLVPWNKGKKMSIGVRQKMSQSRIGKKHSLETRKKISVSHKGVSFSEKHRISLSLSHKGKPSNRKGKTHSLESKIKMKESAIKRWNKGGN